MMAVEGEFGSRENFTSEVGGFSHYMGFACVLRTGRDELHDPQQPEEKVASGELEYMACKWVEGTPARRRD